MRFLCIDLGDKRTGLAVCDDNETIASPAGVIHIIFSPRFYRGLTDKIMEAIEQYHPEGIVLGLPLNMNGSESERAARTRNFAEKIKDKTSLPVFFQDERLSSYSASQKLSQTGLTHKGKKNKIDAIAAAEILKEFIAARK